MRRGPVFTAVADSGADPVARSTVRMHVPLEFPVGLEIIARNRSGLFSHRHGLDLMGWVHMPELKMELMFGGESRANGTGARWDATTMVPPGSRLPMPAVTVDRAEPERRDLWILTSEPKRTPPWLEHYAGHCDQRVITFGRQTLARAILDVSCCVDESREAAAQVEIWGDVVFEQPLAIRFMLKDAGRTSTDESREMTVISSGSRVPMLRRSVSAPAGSDPWIIMRVSDKEGRVLSPGRELGESSRFW